MKTLSEVAEVIRSKNAGPFVVTFDILFNTKDEFEAVRNAGLINLSLIHI